MSDIPKPTPHRVTSTLRDYKKINHNDFSKSISEFTSNFLSNDNTNYNTCSNSLFECYDTGLIIILDLRAPSTTQTRTIKTRMPWYNDTIHMARRNRRQAERKWRKTCSVDDRELYLAAKGPWPNSGVRPDWARPGRRRAWDFAAKSWNKVYSMRRYPFMNKSFWRLIIIRLLYGGAG